MTSWPASSSKCIVLSLTPFTSSRVLSPCSHATMHIQTCGSLLPNSDCQLCSVCSEGLIVSKSHSESRSKNAEISLVVCPVTNPHLERMGNWVYFGLFVCCSFGRHSLCILNKIAFQGGGGYESLHLRSSGILLNWKTFRKAKNHPSVTYRSLKFVCNIRHQMKLANISRV